MDVIAAVRLYIFKIVGETSGMKVLLLDKETTGIVSMVYTQTEILQKEVYLVDRIDNLNRKTLLHLKALCYLRPTPENIELLCKELRSPLYKQYYLFFSNVISDMDLEKLASSDEREVVKEVQELFGDFYAVNYDLFSLNLPCVSFQERWSNDKFNRTSEGLKALLLSLKKHPQIRYQRSSEICRKLAMEITAAISQDAQLFDFRRPDIPPLLLILDRREDPVTPLLNQWTYQAMVHEWIGITNQRVDLSSFPNISQELRGIVLSAETDDFFKRNMFRNFGDICMSLKELVDEFQRKTKNTKNIESIADMRDFLDNYPQFKQLSGTVAKHVTLVGELSRQVNATYKLEVSETEQEIACDGHHDDLLEKIKSHLENPAVTDLDKTRLVLLYALRFELEPNKLSSLKHKLIHQNMSNEHLAAIEAILKYGGNRVRSSDLFGNKSFLAFTKKTLKDLKGVQNVYTQHEPLLKQTLELLSKGRLKEAEFPFAFTTSRENRLQDIIIFIVGGATFEEAKEVAFFNENNPSLKVILGSTTIHNSESFLKEVLAYTGWNAA